MSVDINQLRQDRQKIIVEERALNDAVLERGVETAEETEKFNKMDADITSRTAQIDREERLLKHEADAARSQFDGGKGSGNGDGRTGVRFLGSSGNRIRVASEEEVRKHIPYVLQGWLRAKAPDAEFDPEHLEAAKFFGIDLRAKEIKLPIARDYRKIQQEYRAMSLTVAAGGYTVAPDFVSALEQALLQFGGVRQIANTIRTDSGADLPWPTMNDTTNKGEIIAEAATWGGSIDPAFAQVVFKAFKYSSKPIIVSTELLQDSAFDLSIMIGEWLGTRIGRIQNDHFTTGAGTTLPKGLTVAGVVGVTAASMTVFTADEVISLQHSVDPAYRVGATWMFHDTTLAFIRKLKDSGTPGQYLWQPGLQAGIPDRLLGDTYSINQSMSSTFTTGQKLVLYGQMSKYKIRDVREVRLVRLDELFAQTDQVGFVAFMRTDGNLLDAGTRPVKWLALL